MNGSWGLIWQRKDEPQHAVLPHWGAASIESACRIQSNAMAGIAGSPDFESYLYSQKLCCPNSSFHHDLFFMHAWDWTLEANKYHLFMICRELQGGSLLVTYWAAEQRLAFRFYLFKLSWWKSVHTIYFNIQLFGCPIIQVDQDVVKSALEPLWIWVCSRKGGIQVSRSCRSSAESLSRSWLLMFTLSSCSLIMEPERHKLFQDLGNV